MKSEPSKAIAGCFAMAAFAVAILAGLAGGNTAISILFRAVIAIIICYPVGLVIGLICQQVIADHVDHRAAESPDQSNQNAGEAEDVIVV
jgi:hypothetical protein